MNYPQLIKSKLSLVILMGIGLVVTISGLNVPPTQVLAQSIPERWQNNDYTPPQGTGTIKNGGLGGTRGPSNINQPSNTLMPIVPVDSPFGVTTSPYPTFLVYIPQISAPDSVKYLEFTIWAEDDEYAKDFYKVTFPVDTSDRIITITMPDDASVRPLELNQDYHWSVRAIDDADDVVDFNSDITAEGLIRRVTTPSELANQLATATPEQQAKLYAQSEIWYDAAATLADLYIQNPNNSQIKDDWQKLLKAAGLTDISQESLANGQ